MSQIDFVTLSKARLFQDWIETLPSEQEELIWRWISKICKKTGIYTSEAMALLASLFCLVEEVQDGQA